MFGDIIFRQLFDPASSTYTYVVGDPQSLQAVIIDTGPPWGGYYMWSPAEEVVLRWERPAEVS